MSKPSRSLKLFPFSKHVSSTIFEMLKCLMVSFQWKRERETLNTNFFSFPTMNDDIYD